MSSETDIQKFIGKIHHSDCLTFLESLPPESIGHIVTSPPYNLKNSTGNGLKSVAKGKWGNAALIEGYDEHDDNMPYDEYIAWQRNVLTACMRVLKPNGAIFYNHKWRVQDGLLQDRREIIEGFPLRQIIIWRRSGGLNFNEGYFLPTFEVIYLITKPAFRLAENANRLTDIWEIAQERNNAHPAPFPVELAKRCIGATKPTGVVLDPFMGSGTTAVAANDLGRLWIGCELSQNYIDIAEKRINARMSDEIFNFSLSH